MSKGNPPTEPRPKRRRRKPKPAAEHADQASPVGYRNPPVERQFKKGAPSPNPYGRRGKQGKQKKLLQPFAVGRNVTGELAKAFLLAEAYRPVTIRENGLQTTLPAIVAVIRGQFVAALKGSRLAAKNVIHLTHAIEAEEAEKHAQYLRDIDKFKRTAHQVIALARAAGEPDPELLPHPDDIHVDESTGIVTPAGPT